MKPASLSDRGAGAACAISVPIMDVEFASRRYEHGTAARYKLGKCRCARCRTAVSEYEKARQARLRGPYEIRYAPGTIRLGGGRHGTRGGYYVVRETATATVVFRSPDKAAAIAHRDRLNDAARPPSERELVDAAPARRRIRALQRAGVGQKTIAMRSGLGRTAIVEILKGHHRKVHRSTIAALASVAAVPRGSVLIGAQPTWQLLDALLAVGYTKTAIARALRRKSRALQIHRARVTAMNAARVQRLYAHVWRNDPRLREHVDPAAESERREAAAAAEASRSSRERLRRALRSWDADEFAVRLSRFQREGEIAS